MLHPSDPEGLRWEMQPPQLAIARRVFELFEKRNCEHTHHVEDWFRAESELLRPVSIMTHESEERLTLHESSSHDLDAIAAGNEEGSWQVLNRKTVGVEVRMDPQERWLVLLMCLLLPPTVLLPAAQERDKATASVHHTVEGAKIFQYHCAMCHGLDGRGHGPDSVVVKHPVPDVTLISQRSGGKFPYQRVKDIIEGKRTGSFPQGDRDMPIWGPIFHEVESDQDWGEVRLGAITKHIESIQQK